MSGEKTPESPADAYERAVRTQTPRSVYFRTFTGATLGAGYYDYGGSDACRAAAALAAQDARGAHPEPCGDEDFRVRLLRLGYRVDGSPVPNAQARIEELRSALDQISDKAAVEHQTEIGTIARNALDNDAALRERGTP